MFHYILKQDENSLIYRMLMAQKKHPVKNDFYSSVCGVFTDFGIEITIEQMKDMKQTQFKALVKEMCTKSALSYLQSKQLKGAMEKS